MGSGCLTPKPPISLKKAKEKIYEDKDQSGFSDESMFFNE